MVGKIFLMFGNFRVRVRYLQLEVSWTHLRGEDHHDVWGLDYCIGAGALARLPRPGARRQRSGHRADREHPGRPATRLSALGVTPRRTACTI
jgi:hypothetical protein